MTQTHETQYLLTPTRRRPVAAPPVLISIPNLATPSRGPRTRRRRLRREIRLVGYALLAILPVSMALVSFAGERLPTTAAGLSIERQESLASTEAEPAVRRVAVISLEPLEPVVVTVRRELPTPVILPGILLPADTPEESSDGGH
jgi:hypothetical protein